MKKTSMIQRTAWCLLWLCFLVWIAACSSTTGPYAPKTRMGDSPMQQSQRILFLDENLRDGLLLVNSVQKRLPHGEILVQANFKSRFPNNDIWVEVKFEFFDANSIIIDETEWMKTHFPAMEVTTVQGSSISPNAVKHVILLKNP
jgi:hypothetical protein